MVLYTISDDCEGFEGLKPKDFYNHDCYKNADGEKVYTSTWGDAAEQRRIHLPGSLKAARGSLTFLLVFLLVFKLGQGYGNYLEGRRQLGGICNAFRELAQLIYTCPLKDQYPDTLENAERYEDYEDYQLCKDLVKL